KQVLKDTESRGINSPMLLGLRCALAFIENDSKEVMRQMAIAMAQDDVQHAALEFQADTEAYYGRLANARSLTNRASLSASRIGADEIATSYKLIEAIREADVRNQTRAKAQLRAISLGSGQWEQVLGAIAFARSGDSRQASTLASKLHERYPSDTLLNSYWLPT